MQVKVRQALISVSDKSGIAELGGALNRRGIRVISTGGTAAALEKSGVPVQTVDDMTGQGELFGGRVKTLHPFIYAGILARAGNKDDDKQLRELGLVTIDLVVVNLYPFQQTVAKRGVKLAQAVENIDIGGVALIRAAAKNHQSVAVVTDPADYEELLAELKANDGALSLEFRQRLALKGFQHTAAYDAAIQNYLGGVFPPAEGESKFAPTVVNAYEKVTDLRYGENSHQAAAFYRDPACKETSVAAAKQLWGKELSYNNICDLETALECVRDLGDDPAVVILKHANPCGAALGKTLAAAWKKAFACDPISAFGGIVGVNRPVDVALAKEIGKIFVECVVAPSYEKEALALLKKKKNIRLLQTGKFKKKQASPQMRTVVGGLLAMDRDIGVVPPADWQVVTKKKPTKRDLEGLAFAWKIVKWVKSNAIVFTTRDATVGIGAGQMNRVNSARIAVQTAQSPIKGTYMASDAFFPFRDTIDLAAEAGVRAVIAPGGSIRDQDSIDACNEHGIAMVFTGMRHFRH